MRFRREAGRHTREREGEQVSRVDREKNGEDGEREGARARERSIQRDRET